MKDTSSHTPSSDRPLEALRRQLRERAARAASTAAAQDGLVDRADVDALRALQELCGTLESMQPKPRSTRWLSAALFLVALSCASLLLLRMSSTVVEIDVTAGAGTFRLAQDRLLTEPAVIRSVHLIGVQHVSGELCPGWSGSVPSNMAIAAGPGNSSITVQPIEAAKGLTVAVRATESPTQWELAFSGAPVRVKSSLEGAVMINDELCQPSSAFPRAITASLGQGESRVIFEFVEPPEAMLPPSLPVDSLTFMRTEFVEAHGQQQSSTLLGGTIFLDDLGGTEIKLRQGEWLDVGVRREGWLTPPQTSGRSLAWRYRGSVDVLRAGPLDGQRDLKPSWLEYARTQHALELLWGTALSLFGLAGALLRWWTPP